MLVSGVLTHGVTNKTTVASLLGVHIPSREKDHVTVAYAAEMFQKYPWIDRKCDKAEHWAKDLMERQVACTLCMSASGRGMVVLWNDKLAEHEGTDKHKKAAAKDAARETTEQTLLPFVEAGTPSMDGGSLAATAIAATAATAAAAATGPTNTGKRSRSQFTAAAAVAVSVTGGHTTLDKFFAPAQRLKSGAPIAASGAAAAVTAYLSSSDLSDDDEDVVVVRSQRRRRGAASYRAVRGGHGGAAGSSDSDTSE